MNGSSHLHVSNQTLHAMPDRRATPKPFSIAIAGGGITGLCLANALIRHKIPVHVYEAAPAFTEIGAGVGLGPNAIRAMALMDEDILRAYEACQTTNVSPAEQGRFFNFRYGMEKSSSDGMAPGELICDVRSGSVTSSVHRARFLDQLARLMPTEATSFGKRISAIDDGGDGVVLSFADGTRARHDAVVGCDGIKSRVRRLLLGETDGTSLPVFSGKYCYRGLAPADKAIELLGEQMASESQMYLGRHGHVLTTLIEQGKTVNVVAYTTKEDGKWEDPEWVKSASKEEMLGNYHGWSKPVENILHLVEKPNMWALFDHPPAKTYHRKGKICLLGDAAHASTPHHGAGAGMGVEDALILTKLLAAVDSKTKLEHVFATYDAMRRPRTQRLVASSRKIGEIYDFQDQNIGDNMGAMRNYLTHAWDWIWNEDLTQHLSKAEKLLTVACQKGHTQPKEVGEKEAPLRV